MQVGPASPPPATLSATGVPNFSALPDFFRPQDSCAALSAFTAPLLFFNSQYTCRRQRAGVKIPPAGRPTTGKHGGVSGHVLSTGYFHNSFNRICPEAPERHPCPMSCTEPSHPHCCPSIRGRHVPYLYGVMSGAGPRFRGGTSSSPRPKPAGTATSTSSSMVLPHVPPLCGTTLRRQRLQLPHHPRPTPVRSQPEAC